MQRSDFCIAGAGIIGLSLALELNRRGASVTVLDQADPLAEASTAAAGMLAANDPDNPPALQPLSDLSAALYPAYLAYLERLSGIPVPFQTNTTLQAIQSAHPLFSQALTPATATALLPQLNLHGRSFLQLHEHSVDPGQLAPALLGAVQATTIDLRTHTPVRAVHTSTTGTQVETANDTFTATNYIDCSGAWAISPDRNPRHPVTPRKGQLCYIALPEAAPLDLVVRTPQVYIVPRTTGPHAAQAIIGATVEDCGFDTTVHPDDIARLFAAAVNLIPSLAAAPILESWAGLRPATPDRLPLLGSLPNQPHQFLATGHYRNGILLAPATAHLMAQILCHETCSIDPTPFSPTRKEHQPLTTTP